MNVKKMLVLTSAICTMTLTGCQSMPENVQAFNNTLNQGIKSLNEALASTQQTTSTTATQSSKRAKSGYLTGAQCQNSLGKTKAQIESMSNETLTNQRAYALSSMGATYNFYLSDVSKRSVDLAGKPKDYPSICSLTLESNKASAKVLHWNII